ncbi:glutamyl-tRNA reductase [Microbacterium sediminicola]|uniref:Glutamyl-tRNA reductase n=1 Tax=Microbacterium sediminicola TaxID=415210 RepID=A0ABP4U304_9MICO
MLVCLSANHRVTPFASLERLAEAEERLRTNLSGAHEAISGAVLLATCNRFEAYLDVDLDDDHTPGAGVDAALSEIAAASDLRYRDVHEALDVTVGNRVAHHLFAVASGLDSVVVGEEEIAGQVRRAYEEARASGSTTRALEHLFDRASETSREVKNATQLAQSGRSLVRLALELASSRVTAWEDAKVLLVGTGRYAAASLAALRARGAVDILVHSRTGRGATFAERHDLVAVDAADFPAAVASADVVVTCTTRVAIDADTLRAGRAVAGGGADTLVIDLGMPRNVDAEIADFAGIELLDLDAIRVHAPIDEFATLRDAREIVTAAAGRHASARRVHEVSPSVVAVRSWVENLRDREIAHQSSRSPAAAADIERALRHFSGVMMHHLIAQGHTLAAGGDGQLWADAVATVFPGSAADQAT